MKYDLKTVRVGGERKHSCIRQHLLDSYLHDQHELTLQGFNATLTAPVDFLGRRGGQIREMEPKLHPDLKEPLKKLCDDPMTTVVVLSGSDRNVLDDVISFLK